MLMSKYVVGYMMHLWRCEHQKNAYKDQFGRYHSAYVVQEQVLAQVIEVRDVQCMWSGEWYLNAGLMLKAADKTFYMNWNRFPSDSPTPYLYAYSADPATQWCNAIVDYNFNLMYTPTILPDGSKAIPANATICSKHDVAFNEVDPRGCWKCFCEQEADGVKL